MRTLCVGGAPSSGSTLLADLLDSVPGIACGPELAVFCFDDAYRFDDSFRRAAINREPLPTRAPYYTHERFLIESALPHVGLDLPTLRGLVASSQALPDFANRFGQRYAEFRGKPVFVWAEKTPINVCHLSDFCAHFPDGIFVHIVRDGRSVVASLMNRAFSLYEAAYIWMWQVSMGRRAAELPNAMEVRYEDVLESPFAIATQIARRVGIERSPEEAENSFKNNTYRSQMPRVQGWTRSQFNGQIKRPPSFENRLTPAQLQLLESLVLVFPHDGSAAPKGAAFSDLLRAYGYEPVAKGRETGSLERRLMTYCKQHLLKSPRGNLKRAPLLAVRGGKALFPKGAHVALAIRNRLSWRIGSALLRMCCH